MHKSVFLGASAVALLAATPALAQQTPAPSNGDIIVTATRNATLASKTPVALTAVSGDTLRTAGVTNPTTLGDQVPSVMINRNNGLQITIRGVSSADGTEKGDPSAAFMADGVYIARQQAQEVSFYDIARVEVLRGPQGTLYGRNTTAGAINIITNRPDLSKRSGSADISYGNYNATQDTFVLNAPVSEKFGVRLAANYDRRDSYLNAGPYFNAPLSPYKNVISLRLSTLYKLNRGELLLRADYSHLGGITSNRVPTSNFYANYATQGVTPTYIGNTRSVKDLYTINPPSTDGIYNVADKANNLSRDDATYGGTADFKYDLGFVTLNYLGSYREFKRHEGDYAYYPAGLAAQKFDGWYWQNSQELRFSTNGSGPLRAQAGAYYFKERASLGQFYYNRVLNGTRATPGTLGSLYGFPQYYVLSQSLAGFGQVTYSPVSKLHLTAGLRYTADRKARKGYTVTCTYDLSCSAPGDIVTPNIADRDYKKTTWKLGADYDLSNTTLLYGTVATGYKAGGFNDGCVQGTATGCTLPESTLYYAPETLTSYELGLKTRFLDNRVRLNIAAFHYDYNNLQLSSYGPFCANNLQCTQTTNAASAKVDGVEIEGVIAATPKDRIDFFASWLNARYGTFYPNAAQFPTLNLEGSKLDRSPTLSLAGGYTHTFELPGGAEILAAVRSKYSSSYKMIGLAIYAQFTQPSYTQTEATVTYNSADKNYYVQGFIKNIENNILVTAVAPTATGVAQLSDPRTFGIRAGFKF